jgi:hypothetical protein
MATGYAVLPADTDDDSNGYQPMSDSGSVLPVATYHPQSDAVSSGYMYNATAAATGPAPLGHAQPSSSSSIGVGVTSFYPPLGPARPSSSTQSQSHHVGVTTTGDSTGDVGRPSSTGRSSLVGVPLITPKVSDASSRFVSTTGCKDVLWAVLFLIHLFVIFVIACATYDKYRHRIDRSRHLLSMDENGWSLIAIFIITGLFSSAAWLRIIRDHASCLIWFTLLLSTASAFVACITFYSMGKSITHAISRHHIDRLTIIIIHLFF